MNIVLAGEQVMVVDGRSYTQRQGDQVLLQPGIVHSSHSSGEGFTYFCMHFDIDDKLFLSLLSRLEQVLFSAEGAVAREMGPALDKLLDLSRPMPKKQRSRWRSVCGYNLPYLSCSLHCGRRYPAKRHICRGANTCRLSLLIRLPAAFRAE
ncbi:UNVERIFIED_CONTAM: hypothetical protein ABIC26_000307 [Paenibacillus sp. PvR008]